MRVSRMPLGCTRGGIMCTEYSLGEMDRREFLKLGGAGLAGAVLLGTASVTGSRVLAQEASSLMAESESAATEYGVPQELLLAMGYVNTMWEMPPPEVSAYREGDIHGRGAYGIMQLVQNPWEDTLGEAAQLTGLPEEQLKNDRAANIRGGAAVLAGIPGSDKPSDLNGWQVEVPQLFSAQRRRRADYTRADWRPAYRGNYTNSGRGVKQIDLIVIHIAEGSYSGTISWFKDRHSNVTAHYSVGNRGKVAQCVRNEDIAWHAGTWAYNKRSIGIEHSGYASSPGAFRGKYRTSAKLSAYLSRRYNIPVDR